MADLQVDSPSYPQIQNDPGALISVPPPAPVGNYQQVVDAAIAAQFGTRLNDPFVGSPVQTNRLRAYCKINIDGLSGSVDVTSRLNPFLLSVRVRNGIGGVSDYTAELELDDRDARLPIPPIGAHVTIDLGWISENAYQVFDGTVQDVEHGFARKQGGRRMWIQCSGKNYMGKGKDPMQDDFDTKGAESGQNEGTPNKLLDVLQKAAGNAGHSFQIAPKYASLTRDYVSQNNESFYHFGNRIADEIGGFFRVVGGTRAMINAADEMADGTYPTVIAQWGYNLISWKVHPMMARPAWSGSNQQFYDHLAGQWNTIAGKIGMKSPWGGGDSIFALPQPAANSSNASQDNDGVADGVAAGTGPGRIVINGEPRAKGGGYVQLIGARPGVDGLYHIDTAEHLYSREGYVTWLDVYVMTKGSSSTVDGTQYKVASRDNPPLAPLPVLPPPPPPDNPTPLAIGTLPSEQPAGLGPSQNTLALQAGIGSIPTTPSLSQQLGIGDISSNTPAISNTPGGL